MGRQGGETCAASEPRPVGSRERPRGAAPCRNTTAARANPARNPLVAGQKMDSKPPVECALLQDRFLQTQLARWGQPFPRKPRDERRPYSVWKPRSTFPTARANASISRDLGLTKPDNGTDGTSNRTIAGNGREDTVAKPFLQPPKIASHRAARGEAAPS